MKELKLSNIQKIKDMLKGEPKTYKQKYDEYLASPEWKLKRAKVLKRANHVCEGCHDNEATVVHHSSYDHIGNELLFQLIALCNDCHEHFHFGGRKL